MAQVSSDPLDIKRAFHRHRASYNLDGMLRRPRLISLFYAAECGLKYLLMTSNSIVLTGDLRTHLASALGIQKSAIDLHNLEQLCIAAHLLPIDVGFAPTSFPHRGNSFLPYKTHEAARYGVKLPESYLTIVETWLQKIVGAVESRIAAQGI